MPQEDIGSGSRIVAIAGQIAEYSGSPHRARDTVRTCVAALEQSLWPEVVWRFSALNRDGCPVEFAFSSHDNSLRYTTEVAGPELDAHARLTAACRLIAKLQPDAPFPEAVEQWSSIQSGGELRWGSWLGVRHHGTCQRLKLYIEVPRRAARPPSFAKPLSSGGELLMMGQDLAGDRTEYYFRQPELSASQADIFLHRLSDTHQGMNLLSAFAELCGMPATVALRWVPFGYSLNFASDSEVPQCSIFVRSHTLGKLGRTRQQFLAYERQSKHASCYQALLGELPECELPDHGMLSVTAREHDVEMRVSVSAIALARLRLLAECSAGRIG